MIFTTARPADIAAARLEAVGQDEMRGERIFQTFFDFLRGHPRAREPTTRVENPRVASAEPVPRGFGRARAHIKP